MSGRQRAGTTAAAAAALVAAAAGLAMGQGEGWTPEAGMIRYPDVSKTQIVFVYANDLWVVPREGGMASPLASPAGVELFPKFSDDGTRVVFQGNYDGDRELYTMPVSGGLPTRVTHRPGAEMPTEWRGETIGFFGFAESDGAGAPRLYTVGSGGGLPGKHPVPYGSNGVASADGEWLAYTPTWHDMRTWKRYRGGLASDIWLFNLRTLESKRITTWEGTDTLPMWHGKKVYFLSDAGPEHRLNVWSYDVASGQRSQVTKFADYDVKFPSIGPGPANGGEIVFQHGSSLKALDLATGSTREVKVTVPGARAKLRAHAVDAGEQMSDGDVSPTGKRAVIEARGDIWSVPAEKGSTRNLTDTSGAAERHPAWSPDGRWIAYFSDATGEYELYVRQSDGKDEPRQVTRGNRTYFFSVQWSPDSKSAIVIDKAANIIHVDIESGEQKVLDRDAWALSPESMRVSWSRDSKWLAWAKPGENGLHSSVWLYDTGAGELHRVTSGFFNDREPVFGKTGDYLFYASDRDFTSPIYDHVQSTFVYTNATKLVAVPLNGEVENPWLIEADEETWEEEEEEDGDEAGEGEGKAGDEAGEAAGEDGDEAGDAGGEDGDADGEEDLYAGFDTEHPLFGKWEATASGFKKLGLPDDEVTITLTIVVDDEGNISGQTEAMGETDDLGDVVKWDAATQELYTESTEEGIKTIFKGTVSGETMTGTWEIPVLGVSGTWEAKRTTKELSKEELGDAAEAGGGDEDEPVVIELEGFEGRGMELPVAAGLISGLQSNDKGALLYLRGSLGGEPPAVKIIDITDDEPEEKTALGGVGRFRVSADGKKMIAMGVGGVAIVEAKSGQSFGKTLPMDGMRKMVDPREEWGQIVRDAWRRHRDFFYVENMHGVDWDGVYERYAAMVADAASREDVSFIISEMISELNVGHAYYWGGDVEGQPSESVGLLGVDFELASETDADGTVRSAYRIAKMHRGGDWDGDARGPLDRPGIDAGVGDYVLAVNGVPIDTAKDPWAAFIGMAGKHTTIRLADALVGDDDARNEREYTIKPLGSEGALRYRSWVEANRRYVEEASGGKIGYIHVPDTGVEGQNELFRQFYGQVGKAALIIDERWNGGGQIPNRFIELLNRPRTNYWARRDGKDWPWPYDSHQGPKAMLINGEAGSGGDMFPWLFKHHKIGTLIGTRTWGGLVGISGNPPLIDGGYTAVPTFGFYETDGTWGIEGHGVDPDIEVIDDPAIRARGKDPQIDAAVAHLLAEIERNGYTPAKRPADPDRRGMGIKAEDK